VFIVIQFNPVL